MEVAGVAVGETTKYTLTHVDREIGYFFHFKRNIKILRVKLEQLTATRNDVQRLVDAALSNNDLVKQAVEAWLARVEAVRGEAIRVIYEAEKVKGWLSFSRFLLGRKAETKIGDIQGLLDGRTALGDSLADPSPTRKLEFMSTVDIEAFASRKSTAKRVIEALSDDQVSLFGLYGMPGVGKTTLIRSVCKHVKTKNLYEMVVMVTVSQNPELKMIQSDIANELDLKLDKEEGISLRAKRLSARLKQVNNILIILDDLWERIDLGEVGIPYGDDHQDCKVVITTRDLDVCNSMETQRKIEVTVLSEQDSWRLFQDKAGDIEDSTSLEGVARSVVNECKGLPLAIVTLGRALRNKEKIVWVDALQQLKKSIFGGMTPVVSSITLSYNFLQNETIKMCFLFCCLFPEDFKIPVSILRSYVMGQKIFKNIDTLEEASGRVHAVVDKLISACLLLRVEPGFVMMHDVVRDVAISIASEESIGFIVKAGMRLTDWPEMELQGCKYISMMSNNIRCNLPFIRAPHLVTLSLNGNQYLNELPPDFFLEMSSLLTLDLSRTRIKSLPSSLSSLVNLSAFLLEDCWFLTSVSPVEKLERLEILDLYGSEIQKLPEEIGRLTSLKMLHLSQTPKLEIMPPRVIFSLSRLEELHMANSFSEWGMEGVGDGIATLSEIASLKHLTSLDICIRNPQVLSQNLLVHWESLVKFQIVLGSLSPPRQFYSKSMRFDRSLFVELTSVSVASWVRILVEATNFLYLNNCVGLESVGLLDPRGLNRNCKVLHVVGCTEMKYVMGTTEVESLPKYAFSSLEDLSLTDLGNFVRICNGKLPEGFLLKLRSLRVYECGEVVSLIHHDLLVRLQNLEILTVDKCQGLKKLIEYKPAPLITTSSSSSSRTNFIPSPAFSNLRQLDICNCENLIYVFPMKLVRDLLLLEKVYISNCSNMEMVFAKDVEDLDAVEEKAIVPRLRSLILTNLPKLTSFSLPGSLADWYSLEELRVKDCEKLRRLPFATNSLPKLKVVDVDRDWLHRLQWLDPNLKTHLQTFLPVFEEMETFQFSHLHIRRLQHNFRYHSREWKTWSACSIQEAWRQFLTRKIVEVRHREGGFNETGGSLSTMDVTTYSSRFTTDSLREAHRLASTCSAGDLVKLQKPSEPDFTIAMQSGF